MSKLQSLANKALVFGATYTVLVPAVTAPMVMIPRLASVFGEAGGAVAFVAIAGASGALFGRIAYLGSKQLLRDAGMMPPSDIKLAQRLLKRRIPSPRSRI